MALVNIPKYIEIKDRLGVLRAQISPEADGIKDCYPACRLNGESALTFLLPFTSSKLKYLTSECHIWAADKEYVILKDEAIEKVIDKEGKQWANVQAVESWALLNKDYVETYINNDPNNIDPAMLSITIVSGGDDLSGGLYTVGSAAHALYAILEGNMYGWAVGNVDVGGTHDFEIEKKSRLECIKLINETWGGCLVYDSKNKLVHLRDETTWQNYAGFKIQYKKNIQDLSRLENNDIVTRYYPFGLDNLNISSVNDGVLYVENNSYTPNNYVGMYYNNDIEDAQELKDRAEYELSKICRPRYTYKSQILDLRNLPEYAHETFTEGDMADVIDEELGAQRQRILYRKYNLFQPWICQVELGDPEVRFIETLKSSMNTSDTIGDILTSDDKIPATYIKNLRVDSIIAEALFANLGNIAKLTVNELNTGWNKTYNYLHGIIDPVNYIYAHDQSIQFRTASVTQGNPVHLTDQNGRPLYWVNETHTGVTFSSTSYPVLIYPYTEIEKLQITFERNMDTGSYEPKIVLGVGVGNEEHPEYGKGYIWKDGNGLLLKYYKSTGEEVFIRLGENGIEGIKSVEDQNTDTGVGHIKMWTGTETEYNNITNKNEGTIYFIKG